MEIMALKDKSMIPETEVLKKVLAGSYVAFVQWKQRQVEIGIVLEWKYYNDGKAWMGKMMLGKRNMGWLFIYSGYFTVTFYFMERHLRAIADSDIPENIRQDFYRTKGTGKLMPMSVKIDNGLKVAEALKILYLKKELK